MSISQKILSELKKTDFPDLVFLYSSQALAEAPEILLQLLEEEKAVFAAKLEAKSDDISFDFFRDVSLLDYYFSLLEHRAGVYSDDQIRKIVEDFEPEYIAFGNEIAYSKKYYQMLKYCYENRELDSEQRRILEKSIKAYEVRGIDLPQENQDRLKEISQKLSELSQKFSNNVLDSRKEFQYLISDMSVISEMPEDDLHAAKKRAEENAQSGYLFDASQSSMSAIAKYCFDGKIRKKFFDARNSFASSGDHDNTQNILKILSLREEKARILGYRNYAELSLEFKMAETPEQIVDLFGDISTKAKPKAKSELAEIREYFALDDLQQWDLSYYARKLREEKYALDDRELKKYFVFENVLAGMFEITKKLYGLEMKKIPRDLGDNIELYEVYRDGVFLSYFFTDYFHTPLKRQGAWANILREKQVANSKIVVNVCNFQKASQGPTLLTFGDVETMFHEFGHAIHEMLSSSEYSELSGFHVEWDFVELPSQLLENWCRDEAGLSLFARHYETGDMIPHDILQKLKQLENFGNGQFVLKQNEFAMLDMLLHMGSAPKNSEELEGRVQKNYQASSLFNLPEPYFQHCSFSHIFDGGYAAGYYSYMWAEIIEKEVWKTFKDSGNIFSPELAEKFYKTVLSAGTQKKASELFRDFLGRDVGIQAFLEEKGLV